MSEDMNEAPRKRGIYLLPNLFTVAALFAGFYAIIAASKHSFDQAAIAILVAMLLDGLDGRIARLTNSVSDFGAHFDSLSDMVCFGVTPALVLYNWSLISLGKSGWLIAFIYATCTGLRLARFNTQSESGADKRYFQGLSTTMAAGFIASLLWLCVEYQFDGEKLAYVIAAITVLVSILKVSTLPYRSFKDLDLKGSVPFVVFPLALIILVSISYAPPEVLFTLFSLYLLSGPVGCFLKRRKSAKTTTSTSDKAQAQTKTKPIKNTKDNEK